MMKRTRLLSCAVLASSLVAGHAAAQAGSATAPPAAAPVATTPATSPATPPTAAEPGDAPPAAAAPAPASTPPSAASATPAAEPAAPVETLTPAPERAVQQNPYPAAGAARGARPEPPVEQNPYPAATRHRWTNADVQRVRDMLARERQQDLREAKQREAEANPQRHGDAGAAFSLGLSIDTVYHSDVGFRLFDDSKAGARFGFWVAYDLATIRPRWILSGELGFGADSLAGSGLFGGNVQARLISQTFLAAVTLRWVACPFLSPQLRLSGGASLFDLQLDVDDDPRSHDHEVSGFGALGAGLLLHTAPRTFETRSGKLAALSLGVLFEAGYALRSPVDFALHGLGGQHHIPVVNAELGRLDLSGAYLRTSLVARF